LAPPRTLLLCILTWGPAPQVAVDINHHKTLYELHQKVNSKEQIVGW
jgi:hypothetical protein